jgi:hypothetical protein
MKQLGLLNRVVIAGAAVVLGLSAIVASTSSAATAATTSPNHAVRPAATALRGETISGQRLVARPPAIHPEISGAECGSSTAHWVTLHIYWDGGSWEYWCFGYKGSFTEPDNNQFVWACSGNNYGTIGYQLPDGQELKISFGPGWTKSFPQGTLFQSLSITSWSGSYDC